MEHTAPDLLSPSEDRFSIALLLPRYVFIGQAALIGGFGIMIMGVIGLMHFTSPPRNPFAAYADVLPGQPSGAIRTHGFSCTARDTNYPHDPSERLCHLSPHTGIFSRLEVVYSSGLIHQLSFEIRDYALNVGDLVVLLELSETRSQGIVLFTWHGNIGSAQVVNPTEHFSVLRHVWQVTLTDTRWNWP